MTNDNKTLNDILKEYAHLPEYSEMSVPEINTKSLFNDYPINIAATRGIVAEIEVLLAHGADVNVKGEHGYTPLHNAVEQGYVKAVEVLLGHGSLANIKNDDGMTPVELAASLNEEKILKVLQE